MDADYPNGGAATAGLGGEGAEHLCRNHRPYIVQNGSCSLQCVFYHQNDTISDEYITGKKEKLKRILWYAGILLVLVGCTVSKSTPTIVDETATLPVKLPNPASVYCKENGGNLEIHTAADGSQFGLCVFADGSSCDEWAYFRGECGLVEQPGLTPAIQEDTTPPIVTDTPEQGSGGYMPPGTSEELNDWWGVIKSTPTGAQYDDYFERQDLGQILYFGIDSTDPAIKSQIEALRDSGKVVHLYGSLISNVPDYNGSQILVEQIEIEGE
jgi:putative hemolysin